MKKGATKDIKFMEWYGVWYGSNLFLCADKVTHISNLY